MKRLVWLLLTVFVAALAQVAPVAVGAQNQGSCSCCDAPSACGMPDCAMPPSCASTTLLAEQPATSIRTTVRRKAVRPRVAVETILNATEARTAASAALHSPAQAITPTQVPLFKAHCSFLI